MVTRSEAGFPEELARVRSGDLEALNRLLEGLRPALRERARGLVRRLRGRVDTSDVLQEALQQVYRDADEFRGSTQSQWRAFAQRIMQRRAARIRRFHDAAKRSISVETFSAVISSVPERAETPTDELVKQERMLAVSIAIDSLPETLRAVIIARVMEQESFEEIGRKLGRSSGATRILWTRGIRQLRGLLTRDSSVAQPSASRRAPK